jgi:hypothetical protein
MHLRDRLAGHRAPGPMQQHRTQQTQREHAFVGQPPVSCRAGSASACWSGLSRGCSCHPRHCAPGAGPATSPLRSRCASRALHKACTLWGSNHIILPAKVDTLDILGNMTLLISLPSKGGMNSCPQEGKTNVHVGLTVFPFCILSLTCMSDIQVARHDW